MIITKDTKVFDKRIVITGADGFIGSALNPIAKGVVHWDIKNGHNIFDRDLEDVIKANDVIIHLAALTSVSESFAYPDEYIYTNGVGTALIAAYCAKYKKKLIYASSAAVYDSESSPYAKSKKLAEEMIMSIRKHTPVTILRLFNVFGPSMHKGTVMYNFLHDKKITIHGDGGQSRDFIHINDVVNVILDALDPKWDGIICDIGTGNETSINYVAGLFAKYMGKEVVHDKAVKEIYESKAAIDTFKFLYRKPLFTNIEKNVKQLCTEYEKIN